MKKLIAFLLAALMIAATMTGTAFAEFDKSIENEAAAYIVNEIWTNYDFTEKEGGGLFGSEANCTRAEAVTFLWRTEAVTE